MWFSKEHSLPKHGPYGTLSVNKSKFPKFPSRPTGAAGLYMFHSKIIIWLCLYYAWPDHGVPDDVEDFLKFTEYVSKLRDDWDKEHKICTTICVHCSAGIGRTGVLILAETGMNQIRQGEQVSPYNTLKTVRSFRPNMVQTARQFSFACASILKWYDKAGFIWKLFSLFTLVLIFNFLRRQLYWRFRYFFNKIVCFVD